MSTTVFPFPLTRPDSSLMHLAEWLAPRDEVEVELDFYIFAALYLRKTAAVLVEYKANPGIRVGDRIVVQETSTDIDDGQFPTKKTGREVYGEITYLQPVNALNCIAHLRHSGRTWPARDEHEVHAALAKSHKEAEAALRQREISGAA